VFVPDYVIINYRIPAMRKHKLI